MTEQQNYYLSIHDSGAPESLYFQPCARPAPEKNMVEIKVHVVGLSNTNVTAIASPTATANPIHFTQECVGKIVAIGEEVQDYKIGDWVIAVTQEACLHYLIAPTSQIFRKPRLLNCAQAATIPIAFLNAERALLQIAALSPTDKLWIHRLPDGLGLAALQIALQIGVEPFVTADCDEEAHLLEALGVENIVLKNDKKNNLPNFDIILSGDALVSTDQSQRLAHHGKFFQFGLPKNNIDFATMLPEASFYVRNILPQKSEFEKFLPKVLDKIINQEYQPIGYKIFSSAHIADAFDQLQKKPAFKIVLQLQVGEEDIFPEFQQSLLSSLEKRLEKGLTIEEGIQAFTTSLSYGTNNLLVTKNNVENRLKLVTSAQSLFEPQPPGFNAIAEKNTLRNKLLPQKTQSTQDHDLQKNNLAEQVTNIWREVLGRPTLDADTDFFELGGNSLLAIQINQQLSARLGIQIPLQALLINSTANKLVNFLQNTTSGKKQKRTVL